MANVWTYNPYQVKVLINDVEVTGIAEDSFIMIEPKGDGIVSKTGCHGEVVRAIDPNRQYNVRLVLLQSSPWNVKLRNYFMKDRKDGSGSFSFEVVDASGTLYFFADNT